MTSIGILNMDMGNLGSVWNAVYEMGFDPVTVDSAAALDDLTHLIVPGVGHFRTAMEHMERKGLARAVCDFAASGRPLLGLCVGMQLLASEGTEGGNSPGLGLIPGIVRRLPEDRGCRVPHVGWDTVTALREHPVLADIKPERDFYFVHSYAYHPVSESHVLAATEYGERFASIVARDNIVGCQFHPEKSQANGLKLLDNFCQWDGTC